MFSPTPTHDIALADRSIPREINSNDERTSDFAEARLRRGRDEMLRAALVIAAAFVKQAELFLNWAIGIAEQHGIIADVMNGFMP